MSRAHEPAAQDTAKPVAIVVWERRERERLNAWLRRYARQTHIPAADYADFQRQGRPLFFFMYEQLSPAQRRAEADRLNAAIEASPRDKSARSDAAVWDAHARAWTLQRRQHRHSAQLEAIDHAEQALTHCTYRGGYTGFPARRQPCAALISIGRSGGLAFATRSGKEICSIPWPEINGLRILAIEDAPSRPRSTRRWWTIRPRRRGEAAVGILTTNGDAYFLVRELDRSEIEGKLAKLGDCIGQPSADAYDDADSGIHLDLIREHRGPTAPYAPIAS